MNAEEDDDMYGLAHGQTLDFLPDDVMLPVQFFERLRNTRAEDGYHKLIYAIIDDSVLTYCYRRTTMNGRSAGAAKRERMWQEAKAWLFEEGYTGPFSCSWVCDHLGIEVTVLRKGLRAWDSAGRVPLRMPRRSPTGEHAGRITASYRRERRQRWKKTAVGAVEARQ